MAHGEWSRTKDNFKSVKESVGRKKRKKAEAKARRRVEKKARAGSRMDERAMNSPDDQVALDDRAALEMKKADAVRAEKFDEAAEECQAAQEADESRGLDEEDVLGEETDPGGVAEVPTVVTAEVGAVVETGSQGDSFKDLTQDQKTAAGAISNSVSKTARKEGVQAQGLQAITIKQAKSEIIDRSIRYYIPKEGVVWVLKIEVGAADHTATASMKKVIDDFFTQVQKRSYTQGFHIMGWEIRNSWIYAYAFATTTPQSKRKDPFSAMFGEDIIGIEESGKIGHTVKALGAMSVLSNEQAVAVQAIMNHIKMVASWEGLELYGFLAYEPEEAKRVIRTGSLHKHIPKEGVVWVLRGLESSLGFKQKMMKEFFTQVGKNKSKGFEIMGWEVKDKKLNAYAGISTEKKEPKRKDPFSAMFGEGAPNLEVTKMFTKLDSGTRKAISALKGLLATMTTTSNVDVWGSFAYDESQAKREIGNRALHAKIPAGGMVWEIRASSENKAFKNLIIPKFLKDGTAKGFNVIGQETSGVLRMAYLGIPVKDPKRKDPFSAMFGEDSGR